jgi:hypothetical protein
MHPNFHLSYDILACKYKKRYDYVGTGGHRDCPTLQHHCTAFGVVSYQYQQVDTYINDIVENKIQHRK